MIDASDAKKTAELLAAVAEPTRIRVIHHLTGGPLNVGRLTELMGIPIVNVSHHLGLMRKAGILDNEKDGRKVVYSIRKEVFRPGDEEYVGELLFGPYRIAIRRTPTPVPMTKPLRRKRPKEPTT